MAKVELSRGQNPMRAAKKQPVETAQHSDDRIAMALYKCFHGVAPVWLVKSDTCTLPQSATPFYLSLVVAEARSAEVTLGSSVCICG